MTTQDTECKLRIDLANFYHLVDHFGWSEFIFNRISVRLPGQDAYLVNPFGLLYTKITPDNLLTVNVDGELVGESQYSANPAGFALHGVIHANRHDVNCVAHTHSIALSAVAMKEAGFDHNNFYGAQLIDRVGYHDFEDITLFADERPRMLASLGDKHALMLRNHGIAVCERDIASTFFLLWITQRRRANPRHRPPDRRGDRHALPHLVEKADGKRPRGANGLRQPCARDARGQARRLDVTHVRRLYAGRDPSCALTIADLRAMVMRRLPGFVAEYLEGGAEDENTLAANLASFSRARLAPRVLAGAAAPSGMTLFGRDLALPLVVAPTGFNGLFWPDGDVALARAAQRASVPFTQSTVSNTTIETVGAVRGHDCFQLYALRDREASANLLLRARHAEASTLVITVDAQLYGKRALNTRLYRDENALRLRGMVYAALHPRCMTQVWSRGLPGFANLYPLLPDGQTGLLPSTRWVRAAIDPAFDWSILGWARQRWGGPIVVKGIGHPDDARRARDEGADGVALSNQGGRQLHGAVPSLDLLARVREAVGRGLAVFWSMAGAPCSMGWRQRARRAQGARWPFWRRSMRWPQGLLGGGTLWPPQGE